MPPTFEQHPVPWGKPRVRPVAGAIRHAMAERLTVTNHGIFDAAVFLEKSPELVGTSLSAHRLVKPDGTIVVCVPDDRVAYHAGASKLGDLVGLNATFLGIEFLLAGEWNYPDFKQAMLTGSAQFTEAQYDAGGWQLAAWMRAWQFGYERVVDHRAVASDAVRGMGLGKLDPGVGFNHGMLTDSIRRHLGEV